MSTLENTLKQLRLSGLLQTLDVRLQEAVANRLGHAEFLELICQDEINVRQQRLMERRTKAADFRGLKMLEDFDWSFNPAIHRKDIFDLATGNFIRQARDVLFLGPPGVGKTHLAQAIGYEAIKMNFQALPLHLRSGARLHERRSLQPAGPNPAPLPLPGTFNN
jgi:DNA replication protein DnaC